MEPTKPKKRGRKSKKEKEEALKNGIKEKPEETIKVPKKRGRKPKGGKIIEKINEKNDNIIIKSNIILHLKCSLKDLELTQEKNESVLDNFSLKNIKTNDLNFEELEKHSHNEICSKQISTDKQNKETDSDIERKLIWKKLKELEYNLHNNNISDKKSACFWCTYSFDNLPIHIPKYQLNNSYHVYGCFCSPECATAYLMNENIDSATKFERYYLLNYIYCKIYNYKKNIKPAPNPHYILDKYFGNLTIQEYRKQLKNERLLLVVEKPLTRILPELVEDNDDFVINCKSIPSSNSKYMFRKNLSKQTKTDILQENFGIKT